MSTETKMIVHPSLYVFVSTIAEHVKEGWELDLDRSPPTNFGILFEAGLVREVADSFTVAAEKPTPAERMAIARAAKSTTNKRSVSNNAIA